VSASRGLASSDSASLVRDYKLPVIISASSVGTIIEWYDFYIFGTLAGLLSAQWFPTSTPILALVQTLAVFWFGFAVRPLGAVVFGRIGDLIGRKYAFILTVTIMGTATGIIGLLPGYDAIGLGLPVALVVLRALQGLALGGEYGGAAIYVAEHAPDHKRGFYTSFIQTTATLGFFLALIVVLVTRLGFGDAAFRAGGWRVPFLISFLLVAIALYIRWSLRETPLFSRLKAAGKTSATPLKDSLGSRRNWKLIAIVLFGGTAGQAVVWYTGQFYAQVFLGSILKLDFVTVTEIVAIALVLGTPFFIFFGWLSDRIGRKPIILAGCLIAAITYYPIYATMAAFSKPVNVPMLVLMVFLQVIFVTMVYGPIAAFLVEVFPARIRYTSLSLPYHLGNGEFGGLTPLLATAIVAATGNIYAGLIWPIAVALMTFVVGMIFLPETKDVKIWDEVGGEPTSIAASARPSAMPGIAPAN
jgi:MFS family permease